MTLLFPPILYLYDSICFRPNPTNVDLSQLCGFIVRFVWLDIFALKGPWYTFFSNLELCNGFFQSLCGEQTTNRIWSGPYSKVILGI